MWLARTARKRPRLSFRLAALYAAALAGLCAYAAYLVLASRDLMIADFMTYRGISIMIARLADAGNWPLLVSAAAQSITQDYAWGPALVPGLALALTQPTSRAVYTFALLALYAAPALLALAILSRDLARRAGLRIPPTAAGGLPLGAVVAISSPIRPHLRSPRAACRMSAGSSRLSARSDSPSASLACSRCGRVTTRVIAPMTRRVALALALTLFAMFAFRRWYAFAAAGIAIMLAIEVGLDRVRHAGARFRWKDAVAAAALGVLTLLALSSPVIVDWLPNLGAHDYARSYAAYRKPPEVLLRQLGDWIGLLPALAALGGAAWLWTRSADRRLLRLTLGSAAIAAAFFLRIQSPYVHHLYLIAPAIAAPVAGCADARSSRAGRARRSGHWPRSARSRFRRLRRRSIPWRWRRSPGCRARRATTSTNSRGSRIGPISARAPDAKVCGSARATRSAASSSANCGNCIRSGTRLCAARDRGQDAGRRRGRRPADRRPEGLRHHRSSAIRSRPTSIPTVSRRSSLPSREMLTGQGIGAKFRRTGEVFHLEKGVSAVVFERLAPLDDADIAALQARWRAALGYDGRGQRP